MKITCCHRFLAENFNYNNVELNNSSLVIDGQNFLYRMYKESNLCSLFGCESNVYAKHVREQLQTFQKANVKCYFLFRGGNEADGKQLSKPPSDEYQLKVHYEPLLARDVYKEVLNEMGFDYAICEFEQKRDCVALAQRLNCAVLSFDVEYFFYGVKYIPLVNLDYNPDTNVLKGKLFSLDQLKDKYHIDDQQIATFMVLFDEHILSPTFQNNLLRKLRLPLSYRRRYDCFLRWLSDNGELATNVISKLVTDDEYYIIRLELDRTTQLYNKVYQPEGLTTKYFLNKHSCAIHRCDQEWFAKGVLWKFIPIPYVNVYRYGVCKGSWSAEDVDSEDSMLLSAPIVRYGFDLLTNFTDAKLVFIGRWRNRIENVEESAVQFNDDGTIEIGPTICKPDYGPRNVFENGWDDVVIYQLFEHFLKESVQVNVSSFLKAPTKVRLLIAALVYFARRKCVDIDSEVYAVLLSYVMLGVVDEAAESQENLNVEHCNLARALMDDYFSTSDEETTSLLDRNLLHPLVEFQYCLRNLNFLNTLCGSSLASVIFSKTYNATFVYKVLYDIKRNYNGDGRKFLEEKLKDVPTVLSFVMKLFNIFFEIKEEKI